MDNKTNKKKQKARQSHTKSCQSAENQKTEVQTIKPLPRGSKNREQSSTPRGDKTAKPQNNFTPTKPRQNVDKRPRQRNGNGTCNNNGNGNGVASTTDDVFATSTRLAVVPKKSQRDHELNSVYVPGSKKQNLNHLLNFHYVSREEHAPRMSIFGRGNLAPKDNKGGKRNIQYNKKAKYNKEQYLQANFQFVVKAGALAKLSASPDCLIDWQLIEQINIQTTEEPQCPICLYPPIAAKLTRCGHVYCWPCILHYLALNDKTWRKCPICYEAIHINDLKSTKIVQQRSIIVGQEIKFQLMRRKKGTMYIEIYRGNSSTTNEHYPSLSGNDESKYFSKFLVAKRSDIWNIIDREEHELMAGADPDCPDEIFIEQALELLKVRRETLGKLDMKQSDECIESKGNMGDIAEETHVEEQEEAVEQQYFDESSVFDKAEAGSTGAASFSDTFEEQSVTNEPTTAIEDNTAVDTDTDTAAAAVVNTKTKYHYFYQCEDGQNIFLHPINVKMLQACYGNLEFAPLVITAAVVQKEYHSMDEERRRKFTCLSHLPLTCEFSMVEVELNPPIVTDEIIKMFKVDLTNRQKERQRRKREENKREKHINEINDRAMGKLITSIKTVDIKSDNEFPKCGWDSLQSVNGIEEVNPVPPPAPMPMPLRGPSLTKANVNDFNSLFPALWSPINASETVVGSSGRGNTTLQQKQRILSEQSCESIDTNDSTNTPGPAAFREVLLEGTVKTKKKPNTGMQMGANINGSASTSGTSAANGGNKKQKKRSKKMSPLFSTSMNFNGNFN